MSNEKNPGSLSNAKRGDILVSHPTAVREHEISVVPNAPHAMSPTHDAAVSQGRAEAGAMGVDAWLTEDHTHVVKIASHRRPTSRCPTMDGDALKKELAGARDGAADLLPQRTAEVPAVTENKPTAGLASRTSRGRSGGVVDAPGKKHRPPTPTDPGASRADSQAAKLRAAKTMVKTSRHRGRG